MNSRVIGINPEDISNDNLELLNRALPWESANAQCNLTLNLSDRAASVLDQQKKAWIGKTANYTPWFTIRLCKRISNPSVTANGMNATSEGSSVAKCYLMCNNSGQIYLQKSDNGDICYCSDISVNAGNCDPVSCNNENSNDICGPSDGVLTYLRHRTVTIEGTHMCGAFRRSENPAFKTISQPCEEQYGYLTGEDMREGDFNVNLSPRRNWKDSILKEGDVTDRSDLSPRARSKTVWNNIPLEKWPINVTLWAALIRYIQPSSEQGQSSECLAKMNCYCVAVTVNATNGIEEELLDCSTPLPSLCVNGSIIPLSTISEATVTTTSFTDSTIAHTSLTSTEISNHRDTTTQNIPETEEIVIKKEPEDSTTVHSSPTSTRISLGTEMTTQNLQATEDTGNTKESKEILIPILVSVAVVFILVGSILVFFLIRRKKTKSQQESPIYYSEINDNVIAKDKSTGRKMKNNEQKKSASPQERHTTEDTYDVAGNNVYSSSSRANAATSEEVVYDHASNTENKHDIIGSNEYGVMHVTGDDLYDHTTGINVTKYNDGDNYDSMANLREDERNVYNHSHAVRQNIQNDGEYGARRN